MNSPILHITMLDNYKFMANLVSYILPLSSPSILFLKHILDI